MIGRNSPTGFLSTWRQLRAKGPASTFERLLLSRHVADLRIIFYVDLVAWVLGVIIAGVIWLEVKQFSVGVTFLAAVSGLAGTVAAWAYQTGSKRLGAVDLFASEISTLCRVLVVVDLAGRLICSYRRAKEETAPLVPSQAVDLTRFGATENYTPVFDGNVRDLEVLDAAVVNRTTEFYTYRKVMIDYMRRVGQEVPFGSSDDKRRDRWHVYMAHVIYMLFLASEAARKALWELIEYQPTRAECLTNVLLTELTTYAFLRQDVYNSSEDMRSERLELRRAEYDQVWDYLRRRLEQNKDDPAWAPAEVTGRVLAERYRALVSG